MKSSYDEMQTARKGKQAVIEIHDESIKDQEDILYNQFHALKQINKILDSKPQSGQAQQQKIRSLMIILQRQLDINKKLQNKLSKTNKKVDSLEKQLQYRTTQSKTYQTNILELRQKLINSQSQTKQHIKRLSQINEEIKLKDQLIQRMRQSYNNQKHSMENQLLYLKQKNLHHFKEKLQFSTKKVHQNQNDQRPKTLTKPKSANKMSRQEKSSKKLKKQDIIRRNILALSKKENQLNSGESLLRRFEENKMLTDRMKEIQKGNYSSVSNLRH